MGQIRLPVTFGTRDNYRTELIDFDIARIGLPYNAILGYPALAQFMAATHPAYNIMKMPGREGVLTIKGDAKEALAALKLALKTASAAQPISAGTPRLKDPYRPRRISCSHKTRRKPSWYRSMKTDPREQPLP